MTDDNTYRCALDTAAELLGQPLRLPLGDGEPAAGDDFRRLATVHTFGDSWTRTSTLDTRTRALARRETRHQLRLAAQRSGRRLPLRCRDQPLVDETGVS